MSYPATTSSSIRVVARVKPCDVNEESKQTLLISDDGLSLYYQPPTSASSLVASPLRSPARYKTFAFDAVMDGDTTQSTMYSTSGIETMVAEMCLQGVNGTIICCGQQGTGKTYTLFGNDNTSSTTSTSMTTGISSPFNPSSSSFTSTSTFNRYAIKAQAIPPLSSSSGMIVRAMRQIFDTLRNERDRATGQLLSFDAKISFFQITNEKVYDLLGGSSHVVTSHDVSSSTAVSEPLQLYEDPVIATAVAKGSYAVAAAAIHALLATSNNINDNNSSSSSSSSSNSVNMTNPTSHASSTTSSTGVSINNGSNLVSMGGGVFVRGLREVSVTDDGEVEALVDRGLRARTSDKHTNSSDSHAVFRLSLTVAVMVDGCPVVRHATLTFVDLAGTDRKPPTNTLNSSSLSSSPSPSCGPGLSSGPSPYTFAINLSLTKLRKVANELALAQSMGYGSNNDDNDNDEDYDNNNNDEVDDEEEDGYGHVALDDDDDDDEEDNNHQHRQHASHARANTRARSTASVVSYKESVLTFLLKDALEGDSRTLVITTLSSLDRYKESSVSSMAFAESLRSISTRPQTSTRALLSSHQLALTPVRALLAQQDTTARLLHGAASNKQRLLEVATRDKEQLVKALVVEQAKVVECNLSLAATESHQHALEEEVARLRLRNETLELQLQSKSRSQNSTSTTDTTDSQSQSPGDVLVENGTLAFLQAKTTLIVQQESTIARLTLELESIRKRTSDRVQAVSLVTLEGMRMAEATAAKLEVQVVHLNEELEHTRSELTRTQQQLQQQQYLLQQHQQQQQQQQEGDNNTPQAPSSSASSSSSIITQGQGTASGPGLALASGPGLDVHEAECTTTLLLLQDRGIKVNIGDDEQLPTTSTATATESELGVRVGVGVGIEIGKEIGEEIVHSQESSLITTNTNTNTSTITSVSVPSSSSSSSVHDKTQGPRLPPPLTNQTLITTTTTTTTKSNNSSSFSSLPFRKWFGWVTLYHGLAMVLIAVVMGIWLRPKESRQDEGMFD